MKRRKLLIFLSVLLLIIPLTSFVNAGNVSTCGELNQSNTLYTLQNDITTTGTCFTITADDITLDGNGYTLDGDDFGDDFGVVTSGTRDNLTIKNFEMIRDFKDGIKGSMNNSIIVNNTVTSNNLNGINLGASSNNIIANNTISSHISVAGIQLQSSSNNNQIVNNIIFSNEEGIFLRSSSAIRYNQIVNNIIFSNDRGIHLLRATNSQIVNNTIYSNNYGIYINAASRDNQFLNNQITENIIQDIFDVSGPTRPNYLVYNNSFGEIRWTNLSGNGVLKDMNLIGNIGLEINLSIGNNTAYLNAGVFTLGSINSSANITLYGMNSFSFTNPVILRDGVDCGSDCINLTPLNAATVKFNVTYAGANYSIGSLDSDNDGVSDGLDICPNTKLPETFELLPNHFGDTDGDGVFEKLIVKKKNEREIVDSEFTLEDTSGCSCAQILEIKPGKNRGENINGCTRGTMIAFTKHNFTGGFLTRLSFTFTGFLGDFRDLISSMVIDKLFKL